MFGSGGLGLLFYVVECRRVKRWVSFSKARTVLAQGVILGLYSSTRVLPFENL